MALTTNILSAALAGYQHKLEEIDARMADLRQRLGNASPRTAPAAVAAKRVISPAGVRRIAAAQRKRWAAARAAAAAPAPAKVARKKRRLSAEGRANIIAASKKRWAAVKKAKAAATKKAVVKKIAKAAPKPAAATE